jgi:hypothetical protein
MTSRDDTDEEAAAIRARYMGKETNEEFLERKRREVWEMASQKDAMDRAARGVGPIPAGATIVDLAECGPHRVVMNGDQLAELFLGIKQKG